MTLNAGFQPVAVGTVGRRAVAWFLKNELAVTATDADAAKHAMDIVLTALHQFGRPRDGIRFYAWTLELLTAFPALPDDACTEHEHARGRDDPDAIENAVGYGYVKPAAQGHECGGALFNQDRQVVQYFNSRACGW